ncbi:MAG: hypothetical protein D6786_06080 [Gammaproteobacteria bacterium]|nr:MAG: hypothetical protein D6786_06080 [Gammaproteobacteria bacterium]
MAENAPNEMQMDPDNLYREETYTDQRVGAIRMLVPVTADGAEDPERPRRFLGQASILTPVGTLPLNFEIEAGSLREAVAGYAAAAERAVEETMRELQRLQQEQASSIVVPGQGGGGLPGGGMPGGGIPGGGIPGGGLQIP